MAARTATLSALSLLLTLATAQSTIQSTAVSTVTHTASAAAVTSAAPAGYNGGNDNPEDPSDAGASGSSQGAFSLSKGALAAIIVVVCVVVIGGAAMATLWYVAKKRQWDVKTTLRRASRRLTGRSVADLPKSNKGGASTSRSANRRTGMRIASPPPSAKAFMPKDSRNASVDLEKGMARGEKTGPRTTTTITSQFEVESPRQKGWKAYFGGAK